MNRTYFWILQAASHQLHFFFFTSPVLQDNSGNEQGAAPSIKTGSVSHNSVAGYGNQDLFFRSAGEPAVEKADGQVFFLKIRTIENRMTFITHIWIWNDLDMIRVLNGDDWFVVEVLNCWFSGDLGMICLGGLHAKSPIGWKRVIPLYLEDMSQADFLVRWLNSSLSGNRGGDGSPMIPLGGGEHSGLHMGPYFHTVAT